ncbi:helix-turn-helix transcriptional regulator [Ideonella livida]|uniref:WYL domain-containing protein n=1 Tax=Ideonella livida TaxID=2707176 RepID=A0A7C9TKL1_9BURK|nr:WYL domain-containing protein [Ideonella livida]NDY92578.1 WYL domain-containing protein [Ideonella livida]
MDRTERFYRIELLIRNRGGVNFETLLEELEVSRATLKRDLQYLRERMDAPIVYHRADNLYRLSDDGQHGDASHQLPGVWFSEPELHALLSMYQLIQGLDSAEVLGRHLQPLLDKLPAMMGTTAAEARELMRRVRIVQPARRSVPARWFEVVGSALHRRQRLALAYFSRGRQEESDRVVSPQRLVHYRSTWYLDAWCHASEGLRRFALDAVRHAETLPQKAKNVAMSTVEAELDGSYGIFGGKPRGQATLIFSREAAQWVSHEEWHPEQRLRTLADGRLEMRLPYADATELTMDILRHGPDVKVMAPASLAKLVGQRLRDAASQYGG